MKRRIAIASAFAIAGIALAGCPREQTPSRSAEPAAAPASPASLAPPTSTTVPQAGEPQLPQHGRMRAPPPEPEPARPPPPVDE
jgi:hypothetical protein